MVRGVRVLWRRKDGCEAEIKGCRRCPIVEKVNVLIVYLNILCYKFAIPLMCACDRYDKSSIVRGVGVLWRRKDGCEAETRGVGGIQ